MDSVAQPWPVHCGQEPRLEIDEFCPTGVCQLAQRGGVGFRRLDRLVVEENDGRDDDNSPLPPAAKALDELLIRGDEFG
jgi:hypothetical protein